MKKICLIAMLGLMSLGFTCCTSNSKDDTCCVVNLNANSNVVIDNVRMENSKGKSTDLGKFLGKYYIPYGYYVKVNYSYTYMATWGSEVRYGEAKFNVGQAKELDVTVGADYQYEWEITPTSCWWIGGKRYFY